MCSLLAPFLPLPLPLGRREERSLEDFAKEKTMSLVYAKKLSYGEDVGRVGMTEIFEPPHILQRKRLPPAFVKHNVIDPSQVAQLKGPDGRIWYVQLNMRGKDTYLQDGWKKFVEGHSLKAYYLLLFTCDGDGQFTVQIFDKTACEIEVITTCNTSQEFNLYSGKKMGALPDSGKYSQHKLDWIDKKYSQCFTI